MHAKDLIRKALDELGVPGPETSAPVANAVMLLTDALAIPDEPLLGLATTAQMLAELTARAEVGGYAEHRTVDS